MTIHYKLNKSVFIIKYLKCLNKANLLPLKCIEINELTSALLPSSGFGYFTVGNSGSGST